MSREPFTVILGDDLTIVKSLRNLVETFWDKSAWVVEGVVPENDLDVLKRTCCVALKKTGEIKEIIEKPVLPKSNLRGTGIYLFDSKVFDFIEATPISNTRGEKRNYRHCRYGSKGRKGLRRFNQWDEY